MVYVDPEFSERLGAVESDRDNELIDRGICPDCFNKGKLVYLRFSSEFSKDSNTFRTCGRGHYFETPNTQVSEIEMEIVNRGLCPRCFASGVSSTLAEGGENLMKCIHGHEYYVVFKEQD